MAELKENWAEEADMENLQAELDKTLKNYCEITENLVEVIGKAIDKMSESVETYSALAKINNNLEDFLRDFAYYRYKSGKRESRAAQEARDNRIPF